VVLLAWILSFSFLVLNLNMNFIFSPMSGFLVVYTLLRKAKGSVGNSTFFIVMIYVHRILRIAALYYFFVFFIAYVSPFLGDGPTWYIKQQPFLF